MWRVIHLDTVQTDGANFDILFYLSADPQRFMITASNRRGIEVDIYKGGEWPIPRLRHGYWNLFHITPEIKQALYHPVIRLMLMVVLDWDGDIPDRTIENLSRGA